MTATIALVRVDPIGTRPVRGLGQVAGKGCQVVEMDVPQQPDVFVAKGKKLRQLRLGADLTLGEAARCAKLKPSEVSDLEWGRLTFASSDDKAAYIAALIAGADG